MNKWDLNLQSAAQRYTSKPDDTLRKIIIGQIEASSNAKDEYSQGWHDAMQLVLKWIDRD